MSARGHEVPDESDALPVDFNGVPHVGNALPAGSYKVPDKLYALSDDHYNMSGAGDRICGRRPAGQPCRQGIRPRFGLLGAVRLAGVPERTLVRRLSDGGDGRSHGCCRTPVGEAPV